MQRRIPFRVPAVTRWLCCAVQRKVSASLPERGLVSLGGQRKSLPFPFPRGGVPFSLLTPHFFLISGSFQIQSNPIVKQSKTIGESAGEEHGEEEDEDVEEDDDDLGVEQGQQELHHEHQQQRVEQQRQQLLHTCHAMPPHT